jgi:hypothetical protein
MTWVSYIGEGRGANKGRKPTQLQERKTGDITSQEKNLFPFPFPFSLNYQEVQGGLSADFSVGKKTFHHHRKIFHVD